MLAIDSFRLNQIRFALMNLAPCRALPILIKRPRQQRDPIFVLGLLKHPLRR